MKSVKLGGGFNYTIDAPQFDKTVDLGNGVVHFKEDYRFQMEGDDYFVPVCGNDLISFQ